MCKIGLQHKFYDVDIIIYAQVTFILPEGNGASKSLGKLKKWVELIQTGVINLWIGQIYFLNNLSTN